MRKNTLSNLNKKATMKVQKGKQQQENIEKVQIEQKFINHDHFAAQLVRGTIPSHSDYKKFVTLLYRGLFYSINNLKGPSEQFLKKKKVKLVQPIETKTKILMLDLDETIIHSVFNNDKTDVKFTFKGDQFKFNIRPHCYKFLECMAELYNVYIFTAGTKDYAQPIISYLNQKKKTISGILHRKNCMETNNGFFIKDLRIISNRGLKDIIIVDNLVHSFGLQLDNGIPILEFLDNKNDNELIGLQKILKELVFVDDVRDYIKQKIDIKKHLQINQNQFITLKECGNQIS